MMQETTHEGEVDIAKNNEEAELPQRADSQRSF